MAKWLKKSPVSSPPPAKKVKMTEEERRAADRAYELEKRSRHFIPDWKNGRSWLYYDEAKKMMYCLACIRFPEQVTTNNIMVRGCSIMKKQSITQHEKLTGHEFALRAWSRTQVSTF